MHIANQVFIVTGAASGLGYASAKMLIESGARVMLVDHYKPHLAQGLHEHWPHFYSWTL
ncbi:hypothetical protein PS900_04940 [Pseudomonas fluorescens]|uniref:Uncharacterized protein n=1 Tax=Pseudomonas fluorescens TaxID=294 RepID=A0A8H2NW06_PSEFL|nr:SDR family NAD(P)-dependent oxidoreductase [Pseudomonas fluorescens]VVP42433.1 hypothetical protein PS900_04940 [Pseudomonas fluorescens]